MYDDDYDDNDADNIDDTVIYNLNSCSEDGSVVVTGLQPGPGGKPMASEVYSYGSKWPMLAVRLDPHYARRYGRLSLVWLLGNGGGAAGY